MQQPSRTSHTANDVGTDQAPQEPGQILCTPTTALGFQNLRQVLENNLGAYDDQSRFYLQKIANATEKAFADRALLFDENKLLFDQNNEKSMRDPTKVTVVGRAKVMPFNDLVEAQKKRSEKEAGTTLQKEPSQMLRAPIARVLSVVNEEILDANGEIEVMGLTQYCRVLNFQ